MRLKSTEAGRSKLAELGQGEVDRIEFAVNRELRRRRIRRAVATLEAAVRRVAK